ncbi:MAG TPA: DsrE family protein [Burkholderiaceae bacterium]|nr:DsrE family protein [Burkholderiaceae bacterium]
MKALLILNDPPYGTERCYNALRLARSLLVKGGAEVKVFLLGDAAVSAAAGQRVPSGYYNVADMLGTVLRHGGAVGVCGSCMDARGLAAERLVEGTHRGSMDELADWTLWADKVMVF